MEVRTIWHPTYWLSGVIKAVIALASIAAAILLVRLVRSALRLPRPSELRRVNLALQREIGERLRAEAANRTLLQDNERFAVAADAAGLAFWNFDIEANTLQWDERMFELYGVTPLQGEQPYDLWARSLHADDRERCEKELTEALEGTQPFDTEFRIVRPDGSTRHLRAAARVTREADGRAVQMFGVNFDITERKDADEQFRLALDAAPTGMLLMNVDGLIVLVNTQIEALFGYTRAELLGAQIEMLVPERFRARHPEFRRGFFGAPIARPMGAGRDLYGLRKDGSEMPIEIGLNPLQTSQGTFVLSSIVDLSQRREIDQLRADFVSTVSHELRTPLTSISGSLGLLQSGALGVLPEGAAAMVRVANQNSGRLVRIINDILDIGRLEAGQLALQLISVSLEHLLQQSVEANAGYAAKFGVRFLLDNGSADDCVLVDADRLIQVITNLLSNAAKFSPAGAAVRIRVRPGPTTIRVEVQDSGPGIPEAFRQRVFEKFAQADASAARRFEGTGLGLSIARKLIEAMGGTIGFSTVLGQGTIFYVELPRGHAGTVRRATSVSLPKILYVEDDEAFTSVIRGTLEGRAELVRAQRLREAERRLREERFDLVVLNQSLPEGDAFGLVERIPTLLGHAVPIVLLASAVPVEIPGNVVAVLAKSEVSPTQVATTILSHLGLPQR